MIPLIGTVLLTSLLGSLHCVGMCGSFLALAVLPGENSPGPVMLNSAYNLGRLCTYVVLGVLAGLLGQAIDLGGRFVGVPRAAALVAGSFMIAFGLVQMLRAMGVRLSRIPLPAGLAGLATAAHRQVAGWTPLARAAGIGLLTTLLPCGWLYAYVVIAAGTGSAPWGAATMGVFWLGTLPIMVLFGASVGKVAGPLRRAMPLATSLLIVAAGIVTVLGRLQVHLPTPGDGSNAEAPYCHGS